MLDAERHGDGDGPLFQCRFGTWQDGGLYGPDARQAAVGSHASYFVMQGEDTAGWPETV